MCTRRSFRGVTAAVYVVCSVVVLTGCGAFTGAQDTPFGRARSQELKLSVVNRNFEDVRVYMLRGPNYLPLGTVESMRSRAFRIPQMKLGCSRVLHLAMVTTPSQREIRLMPVDINLGQMVEARLGTILNNSSVFVR